MNRFKLLKVGDELQLIRMQQPGVNDILKPDTLNRTNLRLEEALRDGLGIDDAQIEGVSKDIQLVSVINDLAEGVETVRYEQSQILTGGGGPAIEIDLLSGFENRPKIVRLCESTFLWTNNSGGVQSDNWEVYVTLDGQDYLAGQVGSSISSGATETFRIVSRNARAFAYWVQLFVGGAQPPTVTNEEMMLTWDTRNIEGLKITIGGVPNSEIQVFATVQGFDQYPN